MGLTPRYQSPISHIIAIFPYALRSLPATLHIVRNLYFQHSPPCLTGSLSVECQSLLRVKVKDSVGLRPYSQLECSVAQLTVQVKVKDSAGRAEN